MNGKIALALAASITVGALGATAADAAQGCGPGFHRGYYGRCYPNGGPGYGPGPVVVPGGALIVGNYYGGRGYWDGHRYWHNRYRYGGGWRYR